MIRRTLPCFALLALALLPGAACLRADCVKNDPFCGPAWLAYAGPAGPVCVAGLPEGRVSISSAGVQATANVVPMADGGGGYISLDGRYVTFSSAAATLVAGDTNVTDDIFVHDRQSGETTRVSLGPGGVQTSGFSGEARISADGRYIAFWSDANELAAPNINGFFDVYLVERLSGAVTRVSDASGGGESNGGSEGVDLSADGRYMVFDSGASNLVAGDTNGFRDVFVYDRLSGQNTRVSVATGGAQGTGGDSQTPRITPDGRYVVFNSAATDLVAGDTNGSVDTFVHDRLSAQTTRVSVATGGVQGTGGGSAYTAISSDGRYVAFSSSMGDLVVGDTNGFADVFVHDRLNVVTTRVSVSTGGAQARGNFPDISADGRYVVFESSASNLVAGDTNGVFDVFVHDRNTGETTRVSLSVTGAQLLGGNSQVAALNATCGYVAMQSQATNFVSGDTNAFADVFVRNFP